MRNTDSLSALDRIQVIGDRVLVKPRKESERTASGLYLPPGVKEKEKIQYKNNLCRLNCTYLSILLRRLIRQ